MYLSSLTNIVDKRSFLSFEFAANAMVCIGSRTFKT